MPYKSLYENLIDEERLDDVSPDPTECVCEFLDVKLDRKLELIVADGCWGECVEDDNFLLLCWIGPSAMGAAIFVSDIIGLTTFCVSILGTSIN